MTFRGCRLKDETNALFKQLTVRTDDILFVSKLTYIAMVDAIDGSSDHWLVRLRGQNVSFLTTDEERVTETMAYLNVTARYWRNPDQMGT